MVIPAKRLDYLVRTNPTLAMAIIRDLSAKLRATNLLLAAEGEPGGPAGARHFLSRTSSSGADHGYGSISISAGSATRGPIPLGQI